MLVEDGFATNHSRGVAGASEIENLVRGTFGIAGNTGGAGLQHAEITHAPLRRVTTDQHDAIALLDAFAGEKSRSARRELTQISVGVLLLAAIALDAHGNSGRVTLGRRFEELDHIAIGVDALRLRAHFVFERRN